MPVKKTTTKKKIKKVDYQLNYGTLPMTFSRGVQINDKTSNLSVELKLNFKKDLVTITAKIDNDQMTGDPVLDQAMLETLNELSLEAIQHGVQWRTERKKAKEENSDPDQLEIGF